MYHSLLRYQRQCIILLLLLLCIKQCPYSLVIPTMKNGIEMTMMFGDLFKNIGEIKEQRDAASAGSKQRSSSSTKRRRPTKAAKRRTQV
jgi:hypothetical protein